MIILIRHGEATHHTENLTGGWTDSKLTQHGVEQMTLLAEKLHEDFLGQDKPVIFASDLVRAKQSADIIAQKLNVSEVHLEQYLREKNNGKAANLTEQEARKFYRMPSSEKDLDHVNYEGGETRREFFKRTIQGFHNLLAQNMDKNIIIVSHKGAIQNIIFDWLGMDIEEVNQKNFSVDIRPASFSVLGMNKWHEHSLFLVNETLYLQKGKGFGVQNYKYGKA